MMDILAVDQHTAAIGNEEPLYQLGQRALAGAGAADNADDFSRRDLEGDVADDVGGVRSVTERDLVEGDGTGKARQPGFLAGNLGPGVQDVAQAAHGNADLLKVVPQLGQAQNRRGHLPGQHVEGDQFADGHLVVDHQQRARPHDAGRDQLADERHATARHGGDIGDRQPGRDVGGQLLVPLLHPARLHRHGLHGVDAADGFDQEGLVLRALVELVVQAGADHRRE